MTESFTAWRSRHPEALYSVYAVLLFAIYLLVMAGAWQRGEFTLDPAADAPAILLWTGFGLYIVLHGFPTPSGFYVSLDRITQAGLVLVYCAADASVLNALVSFAYPLIRQRAEHGMRGALFRALHNSAMFGLMVYGSGQLYLAAGGSFGADRLAWPGLAAVAVLALAMQVINSVFLQIRAAVNGLPLDWSVDWYSHAIEIPVALIGVLMALVIGRLDAPAIALFFALLLAIVTTAKVLNDATSALHERKEQLEQKVRDRVADIERQGTALVEVNRALEAANRRQEELVRSLQATSEELERQNREDALTGLFNRRHMDQFLHREHERAQRQQLPLSVAMIDIDHFKTVNDTFSHQVGDAVLKTMASNLVAKVRALDLVARYGGEEILLCMPDTGVDEAAGVCERARAAIAAHDWSVIAPGLHLTASFGLAQATPDGGVAELLRDCDRKLYEAKHAGRNQVRS